MISGVPLCVQCNKRYESDYMTRKGNWMYQVYKCPSCKEKVTIPLVQSTVKTRKEAEQK